MKSAARSTTALTRVMGIILLVLSGSESYSADALSGVVSSQKEGRMEGVLVSAKRESSNITVTVVSDSQGRYAFPGDRLPTGNYRIKTRAVGYDLSDPGVVKVEASKTGQLDLTLNETKDLASQLTNAEWLMSIPGTQEQKRFHRYCANCHSIAIPIRSKFTSAEFLPVLDRMRNYSEASLFQPDVVRRIPHPFKDPRTPADEKMAEYLSSINLSSSKDGKWSYELKTLPRPTGRATKVIITEYDLPRRESQPHDATLDRDGMVWYSDIGGSFLGRLNPRTGEVKEWSTPILKPGSPPGALDIRLDNDGNPWLGMRQQGGISRFNKKTEEFNAWSVPAEYNAVNINVGQVAIAPDGTVWFKNSGNLKAFRLDPTTGNITTYHNMPSDFYGMDTDSQGNLYLASLNQGTIGELNAKTGKWTVYQPPTPMSGPRRTYMDNKDRFWFGEYFAGNIGMFDTKTKQFKEYAIPPVPYSSPYDVVVDKSGEVWAGGEVMDNIFRLDPATGRTTSYLLPTLAMNIQRIDVDNSTTPVTLWVGENHQAKIAKIEPLD